MNLNIPPHESNPDTSNEEPVQVFEGAATVAPPGTIVSPRCERPLAADEVTELAAAASESALHIYEGKAVIAAPGTILDDSRTANASTLPPQRPDWPDGIE